MKPGGALYGRLLLQARPFWPHLAVLVALSLVAPAVRLLSPLPLTWAVDSVLGTRPPPAVASGLSGPALLALAAGLLVVLAFAGQLVGLVAGLLGTYVGERLVRAFRAVLFRHAQRLSLAYHDTTGTADSTYRIQYDAPCVQWVVVDGSVPLVTAAVTLAGMLIVVAGIDWQLALVAIAVAPILYGLTHAAGRRLKRQSKELKTAESQSLGVIQEVLAALRVVKAFGQEDREQERFKTHSARGLRYRLREAAVTGVFGLVVGLTTAAGTAAVLYLGVRHVQNGSITLGELLLVMAYLAQLYGPMETLSKKVADLQASLVSAERAFRLLDQSPDVADRPDARPLARTAGAVEFRNVSFAYPDGPPVMNGVSFRVAACSRVGIEGRTGAGKSTLVSLLTRFYDPTAGEVLVDGVDLREIRLADLRNQFAIVLQEPVLFSTSIAENIAYARPDATRAEVEAAAHAAHAHEFISKLPDGYETRVGERGLRLSGGERQRISLARAFLKDAPILILDEPTSSVDTGTEALIMDATAALMRGRTTFIIAHRLATLDGCDVRLRLDAGRLIGESPRRLETVGR
ncbi:MAG TPA: ABC transporter ATP-binding protein [Gemmataceae bacterium]|jgi:ATP-binding cassette subfamily B protein|nr:ABC transporter ATP-binding protein [Gemmataceae bacterium]